MKRRAELLVYLSRFDEGFGDIARLKEKAASVDDRHGEAMAMALEGWARGFNYFDEMVVASKSALEIAEDDDHEVRFFAALTLSFFLYAYHRVEEARPYLEMAERLAPLARDRFRQAWWGIVGWHQLNWEGRYDEVLQHLRVWQSTAEKGTNLWVRVGLDWQEAITLGGKGDYSGALTLNKDVLETSERIGYEFFLIRAVNVFGWLYEELQDHARALEWNRRGIQVAIETDEVFPEVECNARLNVGDNLMALARYDEAEEEFRFVEAIFRELRPEQRMDLWRYAQHMFHNYGELILLRGDPDRAMQYADECLRSPNQPTTGRTSSKVEDSAGKYSWLPRSWKRPRPSLHAHSRSPKTSGIRRNSGRPGRRWVNCERSKTGSMTPRPATAKHSPL